MDRAYLDWNVPNWITVSLMAATGTVALGFVIATYRKVVNGSKVAG